MDRIKIVFICFLVGLSFLTSRGQQIGNYISNGSFENMSDCLNPYYLWKATGWNSIDSLSPTGSPFSYCNNRVPNQYNTIYQLPRTGNVFLGSTFFVVSTYLPQRYYIKNRLKGKLETGKTYCVKFYVNIMGMATCGNDGFGIFFGDNSIDTITYCNIPLSYLTPQIKCPTGIPVSDTLGWTAISGTFTATGNEKYAVIGIFSENSMVDTVLTNPEHLPTIFTDACIDDVSCVEWNLQAFAGNDTTIHLGDSLFIGRQPDFATDTGCKWYKLPNIITAIDTVSGLWVKPSVTSTYVVRQVLDCSSVKWDTIVVIVNTNLVGMDKLRNITDGIRLFPNPTSGNLNITFSALVDFKTFNITNTLGQTIREEEINIKSSSIIVSTSNLVNGLYQIHFKTQFGIVSTKFVKTN